MKVQLLLLSIGVTTCSLSNAYGVSTVCKGTLLPPNEFGRYLKKL